MNTFWKYFPLALRGAVAVEQAIAGSPGATKKEVAVKAILAGAGIAATADESHVAAIGTAVDQAVAILNAVGVFKHDSTGAAAAVTGGTPK